MRFVSASCLMLLLLASGCEQNKPATQTVAAAEERVQAAASAASKAQGNPAPTVNSARAMQYVKDIVAIGSGAAGLTAAITARQLGLEVLVVEKTAVFGGTYQ